MQKYSKRSLFFRIRDVKSGEKGYLRISESNCIGFGVKSNTYYPWDLFEGLFFAG